mgnify:CR=1 FL=1
MYCGNPIRGLTARTAQYRIQSSNKYSKKNRIIRLSFQFNFNKINNMQIMPWLSASIK